MNEFLDLKGASGAGYRFRRVARGQVPLRIAGEYAMLKPKGEGFTVVHIGMTTDLSKARDECPAPGGRDAILYVRLNVVRALREAEYHDLMAALVEPVAG